MASTDGTAPLPQPTSSVGGDQLAGHGTITPTGAPAIPASVTAPSFVVADLDTGEVLAARDPHHRSLPASCLKILTSLVVLPRVDPTQVVTAQRSDVDIDGTRVGIVPGEKYTVDSLFHALLMRSGNDAAELLARTGATRAQTVAAMNDTAAELGAADTHAATPSGLDGPGQASSAYDLALIDRAAMKLPAFRDYIAIRRSTFGAVGKPPFEIDTENRLLRDNFPGALGGKDGYTDAARHTFVGNATHDGHTYVATLMFADKTAGTQAETLLTWAFGRPTGTAAVGMLVASRPTPAPTATTAGSATGASAQSDRPSSVTRSVLTTVGLIVLVLAALVAGLRIRAVRRLEAKRRVAAERLAASREQVHTPLQRPRRSTSQTRRRPTPDV